MEGQPLPLADVVIEAVGTLGAIKTAIRQTRPGGTVVLMGNPSGQISLSQDVYWRILRKQLRLTGTWNSSYSQAGPSDCREVRDALAEGRISVKPLISHCVDQTQLPAGLEIMREHRQPYCKILTIWNEPG